MSEKIKDLEFFKFENLVLTMKNGMWTLTIDLNKFVDKLLMHYSLLLTADLEPLEKEQRLVEEDRKSYTKTLFEESDQEALNQFTKRLEEIELRKKEFKKENEDIEIECGVLKMAQKSNGTQITFIIPDTAIDQLNKHKMDTENYKLSLTKIDVKVQK